MKRVNKKIAKRELVTVPKPEKVVTVEDCLEMIKDMPYADLKLLNSLMEGMKR